MDAALALGERYGVHVNIALHRAPGYCCNPPFEPVDLFSDSAPRDLFVWLWQQFAVRADRLVIADGLCWGRWGGAGVPSFALAGDQMAQSVHCYEPA